MDDQKMEDIEMDVLTSEKTETDILPGAKASREQVTFSGIQASANIPEWIPTYLKNPTTWLLCCFACCVKPSENLVKILINSIVYALIILLLFAILVFVIVDWRENVDMHEKILCAVRDNGLKLDAIYGVTN